VIGPIVAGPLSDWLTARMGGRGRVWLTIFSLGLSPFLGIWTYSADTLMSFYLRFSAYSIILTLWLPPLYSLLYDLVLPRMRGVTSSIFIIITTLLGLGMGPYFVGIVSDRNGGDLGQAIISINVVVPAIVVCLFIVLLRVNRDEKTVLDRARAGGEAV
jgi:MFS family permease